MSWLPICNSFVIAFGLLSLFLWKLWGVFIFVLVTYGVIWFLVKESWGATRVGRFSSGFWIFVFREAMIFVSLFVTCLWNKYKVDVHISYGFELPFLGCFLLIGSSITARAFHSNAGRRWEMWTLVATLVLGGGFVVMQAFEFYDCDCDLLYTVYKAARFCTVGLHFLHVVVGLVGLIVILGFRWSRKGEINPYFVNIIVWYWHFVDYVWVFVYAVVYFS